VLINFENVVLKSTEEKSQMKEVISILVAVSILVFSQVTFAAEEDSAVASYTINGSRSQGLQNLQKPTRHGLPRTPRKKVTPRIVARPVMVGT